MKMLPTRSVDYLQKLGQEFWKEMVLFSHTAIIELDKEKQNQRRNIFVSWCDLDLELLKQNERH